MNTPPGHPPAQQPVGVAPRPERTVRFIDYSGGPQGVMSRSHPILATLDSAGNHAISRRLISTTANAVTGSRRSVHEVVLRGRRAAQPARGSADPVALRVQSLVRA